MLIQLKLIHSDTVSISSKFTIHCFTYRSRIPYHWYAITFVLIYRKISNIRCTKSQILNVSRLGLQWSLCNTVGTPFNTAPYITGSNIARLGHGSQNLWSKLWIPIVKSAPVRVIFTWKSVPKKSIHGSSDVYLGTQWKQRHDSPWVLPFRCHCYLPLIWHNRHYMTPWSSIHGQEGLIDANCICLRFTDTWAHRLIGTLWILICKQDGPGPCYQNNATSCRNIEPILIFKV